MSLTRSRGALKVGAAVLFVALLSIAGAASAAGYVLKGSYEGTLDEGESISITVEKVDGDKMVTKVVVDQTATSGCGKTVLKKDVKIKNNSFTSRIKSPIPGVDEMKVTGDWVAQGVIVGNVEQVICDGETDEYVAYHET